MGSISQQEQDNILQATPVIYIISAQWPITNSITGGTDQTCCVVCAEINVASLQPYFHHHRHQHHQKHNE